MGALKTERQARSKVRINFAVSGRDEMRKESLSCLKVASKKGGRVAEWLGCWTSSPWVPGSNPTLSTSWICFTAVPSYESFGCACK